MMFLAAGPAYAGMAIGPPSAATPTTGAADNVVTTAADLHGTVDSPDVPFSYYFEYGPTTAYGGLTATTGYPTAGVAVAVSAAVTGLSANTTYHYRLDAFPSGVPSSILYGADMTFTTPTDVAVVPPNLSPVAQIISWPAQRPGARTATYVLDGSTSYDGDGTSRTRDWKVRIS